MLGRTERSALAQLSVFEGGFTLEAAEGVLSLAELWPMDAVQALVDRSLLRRVSEQRFDLLVSVQEYAAEKLEGSGGRAEAEARHLAHFAAYGSQEARDALDGPDGVARSRALLDDLDNLVAATRRSTARGGSELAVATLLAAAHGLLQRGPLGALIDLAGDLAGAAGLSRMVARGS